MFKVALTINIRITTKIHLQSRVLNLQKYSNRASRVTNYLQIYFSKKTKMNKLN